MPVKCREAFFGLLKFGLQNYFSRYDKTYSGVVTLTVGIRGGKVLGIAKTEGLFDYEEGEGDSEYYTLNTTQT